ncbi:class I SAM-dependent methyltransferase [Methylotenera sp.]|uniref:class I SAM-dependent methyltransferase n=1 Tax=Methylotenera sp. TaxID=2051956 RepID=UPI0027307D76|nr:class I SAM-dependent methyltransferase [Methylotenera sp.]MDP2072220.1 class I SAM-dependent methyltransferase [Methylotenera sp.]MDP3005019.1 class I SAM-dependent methyltransferase [Methylotenera sp.]
MQKVLNKFGSSQRFLNQVIKSERLVSKKALLKRTVESLRAKIHLAPATLAILIQCAAFITLVAGYWLAGWLAAAYFKTDLNFSIFTLVLMQALLAAIFSYIAGMDSWWRWIHLCFPVAAWGMSQWHVPSELYLAGFIISLSLFWTTFRTQVPFFPSRPIVWQQVAKIIPQTKPVRLIDIGSGLGDMSMYIAKIRPDSHIEGIEIAPLPWMVSFVRAKFRRSSAVFKLGDYTALDFANYDVIFAYLSPAAMLTLWEKASQEMLPGSLLISLEFEIPGIVPTMHIEGSKSSPAIYVWKIA